MKKKQVFSLFLLFITFFSCNQTKVNRVIDNEDVTQSETFQEIDLAGNLKDCGEALLLSEVADSVEYIKLETSSDALIGDIRTFRITDKYIFVACRGQKCALMFDRGGKFIRKLGKIGQGPGEILGVHILTANDSLIYISSYNIGGKLYVYNVTNNKFVKTIQLKYPLGMNQNIALLDDNIVYFPGYSIDTNLSATACVLDSNGELSNSQIPYLSPEFHLKRPELVMLDPCCNWGYKGTENVYSVINDTIYGISSDSIFPRYHLSLGKYKMPVEEYNPNKGGWEKYILIDGAWETGDNLLLTFRYDKKQWYSRYDKKDKSLKSWTRIPTSAIHWTPTQFDGITNDLDGSKSVCWPKYADRNHFCVVIKSEDKEMVQESMAATSTVQCPEKKAELMRLLGGMKEDDNPIIAVYKLKN